MPNFRRAALELVLLLCLARDGGKDLLTSGDERLAQLRVPLAAAAGHELGRGCFRAGPGERQRDGGAWCSVTAQAARAAVTTTAARRREGRRRSGIAACKTRAAERSLSGPAAQSK